MADIETCHPSVLSPRPGEAQVSPTVSPEKAPPPRTEDPSKELIAAVVEMKRRKHGTREPSATGSLLLRRLADEAGRTHLV
jgi:hypothetical protein